MYNNYLNYPNNMVRYDGNPQFINQDGDERFFGGFLGPFILGGITGGLVAPFFNNNYHNQPPYYTNNYYYPYPPPYYYGPYYY